MDGTTTPRPEGPPASASTAPYAGSNVLAVDKDQANRDQTSQARQDRTQPVRGKSVGRMDLDRDRVPKLLRAAEKRRCSWEQVG